MQQKTPHTIKIEFHDDPTTSFGGLVLVEQMARKLRLWSTLSGMLPQRAGLYSWLDLIRSMTMGLHSGAQGTFATQCLREDETLLAMLGLHSAPEEVTVWRSLDGLGDFQEDGRLPHVQALAARRVLEKMPRKDLLLEGFVPVFADGTLLEGSGRREGTKYIREKGRGLLFNGVFVGRVLAAQRLAGSGEGEGEQSCIRALLPLVQKHVLKPLGLERQALALMDSLHGDGPTLSQLEAARLHYVVGANKLLLTEQILSQQPQIQWQSQGARPSLGWSDSAVCCCWLQCEGWDRKRLLVGRRWKREGEMIWNYAGVLTDLREKDVSQMLLRGLSFPQAIWRLYDAKGGLETLFSDGLSGLGLHHPPCQGHHRNAGFYALASLAWLLGTAVDAIGGVSADRGCATRQDGAPRKRPTPSRMQFWRLRRELFALPGRAVRHGHELTVRLLGLGERGQVLFAAYWENICRC